MYFMKLFEETKIQKNEKINASLKNVRGGNLIVTSVENVYTSEIWSHKVSPLITSPKKREREKKEKEKKTC